MFNIKCLMDSDRFGKTICQQQYSCFPFRLSPIFRLDSEDNRRAYLYIMNTSPGLLAGDNLNISWTLEANTSLYLTDQSATKVHQMKETERATVNNRIIVKENSSLELVPEPIILYKDATLEQNTAIALHPTAKLFFSEIILPGRLARKEKYDFNYYCNRLQITDIANNLLFVDATKLMGKDNPFSNEAIFSSLPIMGNAIVILPDVDLKDLIDTIENENLINNSCFEAATTILPAENGIMIRALAAKTSSIKQYFAWVLNQIRSLTKQSSLPYIPK